MGNKISEDIRAGLEEFRDLLTAIETIIEQRRKLALLEAGHAAVKPWLAFLSETIDWDDAESLLRQMRGAKACNDSIRAAHDAYESEFGKDVKHAE